MQATPETERSHTFCSGSLTVAKDRERGVDVLDNTFELSRALRAERRILNRSPKVVYCTIQEMDVLLRAMAKLSTLLAYLAPREDLEPRQEPQFHSPECQTPSDLVGSSGLSQEPFILFLPAKRLPLFRGCARLKLPS